MSKPETNTTATAAASPVPLPTVTATDTAQPGAPAITASAATAAPLRDKTRYRVLDVRGPENGVHFPADDAVLRRLQNGDKMERRDTGKWIDAYPGDVVTGVPLVSVRELIADGWLVIADSKQDPYRKGGPLDATPDDENEGGA